MNHETLSTLEIDAIGEIVNISLGSSATAISTMLSSRVEITVPRVKLETYENFEFKNLEPAIAVTIDYIEGISGSNIMILKKEDIRIILEILMQTEYDPETFELDEIGISAVCEVMNQMMGASSTALSELLGRAINISTPATFEVKDVTAFKDRNFKPGDNFVVIEFDLSIEDKLKSEFIYVMPMPLVKDMIGTFMGGMDFSGTYEEDVSGNSGQAEEEVISATGDGGGGMMSQDEIEAMLAKSKGEDPAPAPKEEAASGGGGMMSQDEIEALLAKSRGEDPAPAPKEEAASGGGGMMSQDEIEALLAGKPASETAKPAPAPAPAKPAPIPTEPRVVDAKDIVSDKSHLTGVPIQENLDMIMDVPLVVSVEIGRTKKPIREILEITQGSLIVLDKMAGDQVELYANNRCIAKGDVVVVHDNFGIRITEVMGKS